MDADVIVIGAGGGGAVIAKELGERGVQVLVLEAGPWYGNKKWKRPENERGAQSSWDYNDLDGALYKSQLNALEYNMNDYTYGRFRWGPANRHRAPWMRVGREGMGIWQSAGVGGTTLHYTANSPRAFPLRIDGEWPLFYDDLLPYYERVEATLPVHFAPTTSKEEVFYYAAKKAGWNFTPTLNVTEAGYRPQPNAILPPNKELMNPKYSLSQLAHMEGCTLAGHCESGCAVGPSLEKSAKRSTNVSYIPLAMRTGNVVIRPNTFVTKIWSERKADGNIHVTGVTIRDTWTGKNEKLTSMVVVMAAGGIESPRLWLNSDLPFNEWVGRGLTSHYMNWIVGIFSEQQLIRLLGKPEVSPFVGPSSGGRLDIPGLGSVTVAGLDPTLFSSFTYGYGRSDSPWVEKPHPTEGVYRGRMGGAKMKELMARYRQSLGMAVITDDEVDPANHVRINSSISDEHGPIPVVRYVPTTTTIRRRQRLTKIAISLLQQAGAETIIDSDWGNSFIHLQCTMRMGYVVDSYGEAYQVKKLYVADNSVHTNSLGGPNPTLTTQALAVRTAEKMIERYF
ncbi:GMC family oxidoreductase N-terminal domain-containing protein [Mechercharimyces sp. CAU 1602]|uniref:GMC family oxidoreductase N-terminal domain-containing protein n=1 Tax=Mechercharimyces sp. CAU 1602 TaxID=2973933 RepID=UPI0021639954|nr:GMC family oxidoreductase N-terminal domain-containing protein [Mechercharimyces sp. CAU 1602]MCS1351807.1 GMC family oxidoreductase N-terminal domain-containing protein [Mechercharimyces sp. CAU 1602]